MRFAFTSCILLFHIAGRLWGRKKVLLKLSSFNIMFFRNGAIGVEFFFIVSGYLLAYKIYKKNQRDPKCGITDIITETGKELKNRAMKIWVCYLPACIMTFITAIILGESITKEEFISRIPSLFYLQEFCIESIDLTEHFYIGPAWYISSMFIATVVLYPVLRKFYNSYSRSIGPLIGIILITYIAIKTGNLAGNPKYLFFTTKHNIRAFAELSIGAFCYETGRRMGEKEMPTTVQVLLSAMAAIFYGVAMFYACTNINRTYSALVCVLIAVAVTISFSGSGYIGAHYLKDNKIAIYLGSITLPMYLMQLVVIDLISFYAPGMRPAYKCLTMFWGTVLLAAVFSGIISLCKIRKQNLLNSKEII